jgi:cytoskeleton protein RodZ
MSETQIENIHKPVGKTLQDEREAQELTVDDIAEQLRLDKRIIEAIEQDDFDVLPSAMYIRGYLRNYAKILSADADKIIAQYNEQAPEPPEIIPDVKHVTQISSRDKPVKAFTYLVTFILVLLLIAWAQSRYIVRDEPVDQTVRFIQDEDELEPIEEMVSEPQTSEPEMSQTFDPTIDTTIEFSDSSISDTNIIDLESSEILDDVSADLQPDDNEDDLLIVSDAVSTNDVAFSQEGIEEIMSGPDTIVLRLSADSWVEIYDANQKKIFLDLGRSGDELFLRGTAPFKIKFGFSQGVSLEYNGESFDPAPFSVAGVARFTLGD